ncbi:DUF5688 family protein [Butyrivibrio sp. FC2001]|uniref:DUF5688 family protein n=1 Tax=Butyrivibrio sp. FC2001 TaxID=1280671 RepID=UPI0003FD05FD|nr:DUF5688 family protein [Butyrivibrio sp. FC2001]
MITKNMIIEELENRGFVVDTKIVVKNGIEKNAIIVKREEDDRVEPTVYAEDIIRSSYENDMSLEEVIGGIVEIVSREFTFDINKLMDSDYFMEHGRVGIQKEGTEALVKRHTQFEGIEEYLYMTDEYNGESISIKVTPKMLEMWDISEDEAFNMAEDNTSKETTIKSMAEVISNMMGIELADDMNPLEQMYVISNKSNIKGASAILDTKAIGELAERFNVHEFVLLPSSIHECILVPKLEGMTMNDFENMVKEVNATTVSAEDKLIDRAYLMTA